MFGTPIAGALFGVEVLVLGQLFYDVLFPSFVAGIIGFHVASLLGVNYPHMQPAVFPQIPQYLSKPDFWYAQKHFIES